MNLKKTFGKVVAACALLATAEAASASTISFDPTPALGDVGDAITVDLVWTGSPGEYLGDFNTRIQWNVAIAAWDTIQLDPDMGVDSLGCLDCGFGDLTQGNVELYVTSLDSPADLMTNQDMLGNSFSLARLTFTGSAVGATDLTFALGVFGDENGSQIDPTLVNGRICIGPDGCSRVPDPGTLALLGLGIASIGYRRRKHLKA